MGLLTVCAIGAGAALWSAWWAVANRAALRTWCGATVEIADWSHLGRWLLGWARLAVAPWRWPAAIRCWCGVGLGSLRRAVLEAAALGRPVIAEPPPGDRWHCAACERGGRYVRADLVRCAPNGVMTGVCGEHVRELVAGTRPKGEEVDE